MKRITQDQIVELLKSQGYTAYINPTDEETVFVVMSPSGKFEGTDEEMSRLMISVPVQNDRFSYFGLGGQSYFCIWKQAYGKDPWMYHPKNVQPSPTEQGTRQYKPCHVHDMTKPYRQIRQEDIVPDLAAKPVTKIVPRPVQKPLF